MLSRSCSRCGFIVVLLAAAVAVSAQTPDSPDRTSTAPKLEFSPDHYDFGEVWEGVELKQVFTIRNTGNAPLELSGMKTTCSCTVPSQPASPLAPGATTTITITYDSLRVGKASQRVTFKTNDPAKPELVLSVKGEVKPIFAAQPPRGIRFDRVEPASVTSRAMKLKNRYSRPVELKLKEGQEFGNFDVQLKEIKKGQEYELVATTKPPLRLGQNRANVKLLTGLDQPAELTYYVFASAQPSVFIAPYKLMIGPEAEGITKKQVRVVFDRHKPIEITKLIPSDDAIKAELLPATPPHPQARTGYHKIEITLPPFTELPDGGAKLEILTDSKLAGYDRLELPILKREKASRPKQLRFPGEAKPLRPTPRPGGDKPKEKDDG
jgi:hypothetical protein